MENNNTPASEVQGELGAVRIANEVVAVIAGLAATEIPGIAGMSGGGVGGGIAEMLGRKNLAKGVKVEVGEKEAAVDLFIIVEYGVPIPDVAFQAQSRVKRAIESMTGLKVVEVNVHVQGVVFARDEEHPAKEETPPAQTRVR
ncbi:Asp23/Gls24 family envelope stress response protein [Desulforudis sp. 1088]|uniref:Asp23/Gls24 family envelope stress response protein n=1 Tax=unclassified Candidatus Desulforudis TaxID=2635950 RepID=UPI0034966F37